MIRAFIASLALSTLCIPEVQAFEFTENHLLGHFAMNGGRVYIDSALCDRPVFGVQQGNTVHICATNHQGNAEELKDTIRHEMWHVVQMCARGPISPYPAAIIGQASDKGWTVGNYPPHQWHLEAEAHYIAATFTAEQIKNAFNKACLSE